MVFASLSFGLYQMSMHVVVGGSRRCTIGTGLGLVCLPCSASFHFVDRSFFFGLSVQFVGRLASFHSHFSGEFYYLGAEIIVFTYCYL